MAKRDTFPFAPERQVIDHFLVGKTNTTPDHPGEIEIMDGALRFGGVRIAHYDTGGSLVAVPGWDMMGGYITHIIHYMLERLGSDARIVRQRDLIQEDEFTHGFHMRYFFEDREIRTQDPIVLAGPLMVQAYRMNPTVVNVNEQE